MRRALRGSDGRFFGGGGGGGSSSKRTQQDQDKENDAPNNLNGPSSLASISSEVPMIKEDIVLTNKNILRPKRENSEEKNSRRMSTPVRIMNEGEEGMVSPLAPAQQVVVNRSRHIRFDLPDSPASPSMNETLTPPPKEFKRANYKTLRAERCLSTVVTKKEWAVVRDMERLKSQEQPAQESSPKPPQGIVRSLCRLYSKENIVSPGPPSVKRSSSFDGRNSKGTLAVVVDHGQHSPATSEASDASMSYAASSGKASSVSPGSEASSSEVPERKGSFRLFRSRSWSLRRKRGEQQKGNSQPKRCSPSCSSTKSQDSGFSDNEGKTNKVRPASTPPTSRSMGTSTRDDEDEEDPNLTQVPSGQKVVAAGDTGRKIYQYSPSPSSPLSTARDNQRRQREWLLREERGGGGVNDNVDKSCTLPAVAIATSRDTSPTSSSPRRAVASSLGNIASLQEGLRIKARLCEEEENESRTKRQNSRQSLSATNLLKAACEEEENKASKQFYFADVKRYQEKLKEQQRKGVFDYRHANNVVVENDIDISRLSEFEIDGGGRAPAFSTPVRASFRQRNHAVRSMIESARTPIKAENGRTRPREVKRNTDERQRRCRSSDASHYEPNVHERSEVPSTIDPSMVAVWSRFLNYEASVPELSSFGPLTPEVGDAEDNVSYSTSVRQLLIKGEASRRNRMPSSPERLREAENRRHFEDVDEGDLTRLSHLPSYAVDGTETQLLVESLNRTRPKRLSDALIFAERSLAESQTSTMKGLLPPVLDQSTLLSQSPLAFVTNVHYHNQHQQHPNHHLPSPPASLSDSRNSSSCSSTDHHDNNNQQQQQQQRQQQQQALRSPHKNNMSMLNTSPVDEWWRDLHAWCEPECMTYLQSKPIVSHTAEFVKTDNENKDEEDDSGRILDANKLVEALQRVQRGAREVHLTLNALNNHFCSTANPYDVGRCLQALITHVQQFVFDNSAANSILGDAQTQQRADLARLQFPGLKTSKNKTRKQDQSPSVAANNKAREIVLLQQRSVLQVLDRLKLCAHRCQYSSQQPIEEMRRILAALETHFNKLVDMTLAREMQCLITELDSPHGMVSLRTCLHTLILLGNEGSTHLCALLSRAGAVRAAIRHCRIGERQEQQQAEIRILALRALSSVCCVAECVREFEQCGGLEVLDTLLCSRLSSVDDRVESAGVLAQITSPWIADNHRVPSLDAHVASMVGALTGLARLNDGQETFLLVTAALANLTFMSAQTSPALRRCNTARTLVRAVRAAGTGASLFARDQVVTVLANMAASSSCRPDLRAVDGVRFLIDMLDSRASNNNNNNNFNQAEVAAAERVQKKAAIALSRLCSDTQVCYDVLRLSGADKLVSLCKDPRRRNHSDAVLVACLAVLRRIKNNVDNDEVSLVFDNLDADDLFKPRMVDSFLEYSAKQESYV